MGAFVLICSVVSDSLQLHGLWSTSLLCPWGFSRQEYWNELPCPSPGDLLQGLNPCFLCLLYWQVGSLSLSITWEVPGGYKFSQFNQFSHSVMSYSLQPHGLQHSRPPCPSPTPRACLNSVSIESVMPSNHLILCHILLLPSVFR